MNCATTCDLLQLGPRYYLCDLEKERGTEANNDSAWPKVVSQGDLLVNFRDYFPVKGSSFFLGETFLIYLVLNRNSKKTFRINLEILNKHVNKKTS